MINTNAYSNFATNQNFFERNGDCKIYEKKESNYTVRSEVNENGDVTIQLYFAITKGETISNIVLLERYSCYKLNIDTAKFQMISAENPQTSFTYMYCLVNFPRFISNTQPLAQSLSALVGERSVYRVADYTGENYQSGSSNLDIDLQASALVCTVSNNQIDAQNRIVYCVTIKGTATLKATL
jgi:hypothetical protein